MARARPPSIARRSRPADRGRPHAFAAAQGAEADAPADARFVGHYRDRWVAPADVPTFTRFTLTVLYVIKLGPGEETSRAGGLMVTTGGR